MLASLVGLSLSPVYAGVSGPIYAITDPVVSVPRRSDAEWARLLAASAKRRKVEVQWRDPASGEVQAMDWGALETPALIGSWLALEGVLEDHSESDLVLGAGELRPVTLWWEGPKRLVVSQGPSIALPGEGPPIEAIVGRHGLAGHAEEGAVFEPRVRGVLDGALERLTDAERAALAGVRLVRTPGQGGKLKSGWMLTAEYVVDDQPARIRVFDNLLVPTGRFVGPVVDPRHPAFAVLLHEVAHALDDAPRRTLQDRVNARIVETNAAAAAYNADVDAIRALPAAEQTAEAAAALNARLDALNAENATIEAERATLKGIRPVSAGFRERFGAITKYGATEDGEAFAEAFALFHLDPAALGRVSPEALAWFQGEGHLPPG